MRPLGKTYLIKAEIKRDIELVNGLYIPSDSDCYHDIYYQGIIVSHGLGFSENEINDLVPVGTKVVFNYKGKNGTKLIFGNNVYYIKNEDQVLGVIEDE